MIYFWIYSRVHNSNKTDGLLLESTEFHLVLVLVINISKNMSESKLLGIWGRKEWGGDMDSFDSANLEAGKGLAEDASFGSERQVTIIEEEVWTKVMDELESDLPPQTRRANLMVSGIRLKETKGKILQIGKCRIEIMGETAPCVSMDRKLPGLKNALKPNWNGGAYGKVLDSGKISVGDPVTWQE